MFPCSAESLRNWKSVPDLRKAHLAISLKLPGEGAPFLEAVLAGRSSLSLLDTAAGYPERREEASMIYRSRECAL